MNIDKLTFCKTIKMLLVFIPVMIIGHSFSTMSANASSIISLEGDQDNFGTGAPSGSAVRIIDFMRNPLDGDFDMDPALWCTQRFFNWSHDFVPPVGEILIGASLTVVSFDIEDAGAGDGKGGGPFDTTLSIDGVDVPNAFDDTFTPDITVNTFAFPNTTVFDLEPNFFQFFEDGTADIEVDAQGGELFDCIAIDFALLILKFGVPVLIDIKPEGEPNSINCDNDNEVITVAILSVDDFDATSVDHTTVTFEGAMETHTDNVAGELKRHEEDVDNDGDTDLIMHFRLSETDLTCDSIEGVLTGETFDGQTIIGTDSVRMVDSE